MVNEDILQNKAFGDAWSAFYEGAIETANRLQYMTNADKLNVSSQLLDRGVMSINDIREIWNLPPVDGGDVRIIRGEYWNADEKVSEESNDEGNS